MADEEPQLQEGAYEARRQETESQLEKVNRKIIEEQERLAWIESRMAVLAQKESRLAAQAQENRKAA